jgi:processive 1,2-diacylglycerol beta-glucosyltransferase
LKRILILTAGYGEGHNSAARGLRDGLARVRPDAVAAVHDVFAETYGVLHHLVRKSYLTVVNRWPGSWGRVYRWLDQKREFDKDFARFGAIKRRLRRLILEFQPEVIVPVFPAYAYLINQVCGAEPDFKTAVIVTDSITVNAIWYRGAADYFLLPNEQSADVLRRAGIAEAKIKTPGFPVNPVFADLPRSRSDPGQARPRVLYMINIAALSAPETIRRLLDLEVDLTVTVGRSKKLARVVSALSDRIKVVGWTDQLPRMMCDSHLLIGKAGGATVQETIAAACPMIVNHVVSGQEEGNAQLISQTASGAIALSAAGVSECVERAFAGDGLLWREWATNISRLSRPRAAMDIARFLLSL